MNEVEDEDEDEEEDEDADEDADVGERYAIDEVKKGVRGTSCRGGVAVGG